MSMLFQLKPKAWMGPQAAEFFPYTIEVFPTAVAKFERSETNCGCALAYTVKPESVRALGRYIGRRYQARRAKVVCGCYGRLVKQ